MPLFTSSSERLPSFRGWRVIVTASLLFLVFVVMLESLLAIRGFHPGVDESVVRWVRERTHASQAGSKALILLGASRIQLGADMDTLRSGLGLHPVQLAIDGGSFVPVLEGLARDKRINGTIVVDFDESFLVGLPGSFDMALQCQRSFDTKSGMDLIDFKESEAWLKDGLSANMRSYADGTRPLTALFHRVLDPRATPRYVVSNVDRSRVADYSLVSMPDFYYQRVLREMGATISIDNNFSWKLLDAALSRDIELMPPSDNTMFLERMEALVITVEKIEARGGKVFFIRMPTSGLIHQIQLKRFPRNRFWAYLEQRFPGRVINSDENAVMSHLVCPDGSHLDKKDRKAFTLALVQELRSRGVGTH
ncbi:MAG: hypothetical protein PSX71_10765 [bacterium]|nr:hypothetical protein [bacterium]